MNSQLRATIKAKPKSMYVDIWNRLKLHGTCRVAAHHALHKRIVHAVVNKKYYDTAHKMLLEEKSTYCKLLYKKTTNTIEFRLVYHIDKNYLETLTAEDL